MSRSLSSRNTTVSPCKSIRLNLKRADMIFNGYSELSCLKSRGFPVHGSMRRLKWADVPKGGAMGSGTLHLDVLDDGRMIAVKKTGGFGGSEWTRN